MKKIKISFQYGSLAALLEKLRQEGISEKDFDKVEFETDYSDCYYEGDTPTMVATFNKSLTVAEILGNVKQARRS